MTPIAVAIVNYNTRGHLRACLATVQSEKASEVIVVDNASSDGSVEMVRSEYPSVTLHANEKNLGYGAAANQAIASCNAPYVLLLNADTLVETGALRTLSTYLDQNLRVAMVGPRLVNSYGVSQRSWFAFPSPYVCHTWITAPQLDNFCGKSPGSGLIHYLAGFRNQEFGAASTMCNRVVGWLLGAAIALRREAFEAVGGFDESFFMYFEEVDLCYRLRNAGWEVHFSPTATIAHVGGASTRPRRAAMMWRFFQSETTFYRRHYSKLLTIQFKLVLTAVMLVRISVGAIQLYCKADTQGIRLAEDLGVWRSILSSLWHPRLCRNEARRNSG